MKMIKYAGFGLIGLLVLSQVLMFVASESAEVVVLTIPVDDDEREIRLWVVDYDGSAYLRGDEQSGWMPSLRAAQTVELERNGVSVRYQPRIDTEVRDEINAAMLTKYGWRERYITLLLGDRDGAMPVEMVPLS
jgi:hypothetical protein